MPQNHSFVEPTAQSSRDLTFPTRRTCFLEGSKISKKIQPTSFDEGSARTMEIGPIRNQNLIFWP